MKNIIIVIALAILIVLGGIFLLSDSPSSPTPQGSVPESTRASTGPRDSILAFADHTFVDFEGNDVQLSQFIGTPLVVNSWAVWCPFCREELPDFVKLQKEYGDDVVVIAIDRQESLKKAKGYTDGLNLTGEIRFLLDSSDFFYRNIGGFSMPETLFIDSEGGIVVHKRGFMALEEMREHTRKIVSSN